jgi:WD40 repeat protein
MITLDTHYGYAHAVEFSHDGKRLVSAGQDGCVRVWSLPNCQPVAVLEGHRAGVSSMSFSPDGALLATGCNGEAVRIWSFPEGRCVRIFEEQSTPVFSPDAVTLATISPSGEVVLWDADHGEEIQRIPPLDKRTLALAFTPDGDLLVGGTGPIRRVALPAGTKVGKLQGHEVAVVCMRLTPDGKLLASTGADATLRLWSTRNWIEVRRMRLKSRGTFQIAVAAKGDRIAVSAERGIEIYSLKEGSLVEHIELPVDAVHGLAFSKDGRWLANGAADGVRLWEMS